MIWTVWIVIFRPGPKLPKYPSHPKDGIFALIRPREAGIQTFLKFSEAWIFSQGLKLSTQSLKNPSNLTITLMPFFSLKGHFRLLPPNLIKWVLIDYHGIQYHLVNRNPHYIRFISNYENVIRFLEGAILTFKTCLILIRLKSLLGTSYLSS